MKRSPSQDLYVLRDTDADFVVDDSDGKYTIPKMSEVNLPQRPREKLLRQGPSVLSVQELLSIIINTGTRKESVTQMTSRIIQEYGERGIANETDPRRLERYVGISRLKASQIIAAFELGKRFFDGGSYDRIMIREAKDVFTYTKDMRDLPREQLRALYLNSRQELVHDEVISMGNITAHIAHPQEVFRPALARSANATILVHNHPSGSTKPSRADIELTRRMAQAGSILGTDLLDHIIITKRTFARIRIESQTQHEHKKKKTER